MQLYICPLMRTDADGPMKHTGAFSDVETEARRGDVTLHKHPTLIPHLEVVHHDLNKGS